MVDINKDVKTDRSNSLDDVKPYVDGDSDTIQYHCPKCQKPISCSDEFDNGVLVFDCDACGCSTWIFP